MEENKDEVTITYETLFELSRREKERSELQKLDSSFFINVLRYLKDKQAIIGKQQGDLFSAEEKRKTEYQLENVKRIIRELYDKREKKIITMALDKSKNKAAILDSSVFLNQEKELFDNAVRILERGRENVLLNLINLREPVSLGILSAGNKDASLGSSTGQGSEIRGSGVQPKEEKKKDTKLVRFLNAVPKFVGKELEEYGPFEEEDIASLPVEIVDVLIKKGRVEEISED